MAPKNKEQTLIVFDLETSSIHTVGQILNLSFIVVNREYRIKEELNLDFKLSKTQIPDPEAIKINQVDVLQDGYSELAGFGRVEEFLLSYTEKQPCILAGHNSTKFDIPYLRTGMIRNGYNPYLGSNLQNKDTLHFFKYLAIANKEFREALVVDGRTSCGLQNIAKVFGKTTERAHHSRDDVLLLLEILEEAEKRFDKNIWDFESYQARGSEKKGSVYVMYNLDKTSSEIVSSPITLIDANKNYRLFCDLKLFNQDKPEAIFWVSAVDGFMITDKREIESPQIKALAARAVEAAEGVTLDNYFDEKTCDVEQFIYMLNFQEMRAIQESIHRGDDTLREQLNSSNVEEILKRYRINQNIATTEEVEEYVKYRYGIIYRGSAGLSEFIDSSMNLSKFNDRVILHPSYIELKQKAFELRDSDLGSVIYSNLLDYTEDYISNL